MLNLVIGMSCTRAFEDSGTGAVIGITDSGLTFSDDIVVKTDSIGQDYYHSTFLYADSLFYGISIDHPNIIEILNIGKRNLESRIFIDSALIQGGASGLSVISKDSICLGQNNPTGFVLLDSTGNITNRMCGKNTSIHYFKGHRYRNEDFMLCSFLAAFKPVVSDDGTIYDGIDPYGLYSKMRKLNRVGVFSLKTDKWNAFFCNKEEFGSMKRGYGFPYDLEQPYVCLSDSLVIVSFPMEHNVGVYDKTTLSYKGQYRIKTGVETLFPKPKKMVAWDSCQKSWDFRQSTPFYGPIMSHKKSKAYSRIVYHETELFDDEGNPCADADRDVSVIVFDENFCVVTEVILPKGTVCFNGYWALSDGILLTNRLCGRDSIVFKKLKIEI